MSNHQSTRRTTYRTEPGSDITVKLELEGLGVIDVLVADLSAGGAGLLRTRLEGLRIQRDHPARVILSSPHIREPLIIPAKVVNLRVEEQGEHIRLGLAFLDWETERESMGARIRAMFNKRKSVRVPPSPDQAFSAMVQPKGGFRPYELSVRDLSVEGIGFQLRADQLHRFPPESTVEVVFRVPHCRDRHRCEGTVRFGTQVANSTVGLLGVRFVDRQKQGCLVASAMRR